jgi:hypothetical protein
MSEPVPIPVRARGTESASSTPECHQRYGTGSSAGSTPERRRKYGSAEKVDIDALMRTFTGGQMFTFGLLCIRRDFFIPCLAHLNFERSSEGGKK